MYLHADHRFANQDAVLALVDAHPLGAWVCHAGGGLFANDLPFLLDRSRGPLGTLIGHVSRANPVWRHLDAGAPSVVMFRGAQAYVTPGWYPGKAEHGEVVPTWDYAVAHAHGTARAVQDAGWLLDMLTRLTDRQESAHACPWRVADAPAAYIERLRRGIVGIEITIDRLEGKLKASQDEATADRLGTVQGLQRSPRDEDRAMAELVRRAIDDHPAGPS